jgi:hypothetical protein
MQLATIEPSNSAIAYRQATDAAGICKQIVLKTVKNIQGKQYVQVEGWQAIATAHGCIAQSRDVKRTESGFSAIGEIRRMSDGAIIATAEGFVGDDEKMWAGRPEFARRAMAQTRSISRACRSAFAHVVVMMDAGLSTTPAEEMESVEVESRSAANHPVVAKAAKVEKPAVKKEFTEQDRNKFISAVMKNNFTPEEIQAYAIAKNIILPSELADCDWPLEKLPQTKADFSALMDDIKQFVAINDDVNV